MHYIWMDTDVICRSKFSQIVWKGIGMSVINTHDACAAKDVWFSSMSLFICLLVYFLAQIHTHTQTEPIFSKLDGRAWEEPNTFCMDYGADQFVFSFIFLLQQEMALTVPL